MEDEMDVTLAEDEQSNLQNPETGPEKAPEASHKKEEVQEPVQEQISHITPKMPNNPDEWFKAMKWAENPFILNIIPELFVGYQPQSEELIRLVKEKHKTILVIGPTGSGKTTLLEWLSKNLDKRFDSVFVGKPPQKSDEFVDIFNEKYPRFLRKLKNVYQIPGFLKKSFGITTFLCLFKEALSKRMT